jgi:hypothetical protein
MHRIVISRDVLMIQILYEPGKVDVADRCEG